MFEFRQVAIWHGFHTQFCGGQHARTTGAATGIDRTGHYRHQRVACGHARYFNVAGPCVPDKHDILPTSTRCTEIHLFIASGMFFVIRCLVSSESGRHPSFNR